MDSTKSGLALGAAYAYMRPDILGGVKPFHEPTDTVACAVFETATRRRVPVTMALTREVMSDLKTHVARCCRACEVVDTVQAANVFFVARGWMSSIAATRVRAAR